MHIDHEAMLLEVSRMQREAADRLGITLTDAKRLMYARAYDAPASVQERMLDEAMRRTAIETTYRRA